MPIAIPAGLPLLVPMYPTAGPAAATPYPPTSSTLMYSHGEFPHPSSLSMGVAATVASSSTAATTSGVTSYPSGPFAVGADVFEVQPKPSVLVTAASASLNVTATPGPPTQNTVVPSADAVRGSTLRVGVAVTGVPSATVAACGSTLGDVKSTVDGVTQSTSAVVAVQSSTTSVHNALHHYTMCTQHRQTPTVLSTAETVFTGDNSIRDNNSLVYDYN